MQREGHGDAGQLGVVAPGEGRHAHRRQRLSQHVVSSLPHEDELSFSRVQ